MIENGKCVEIFLVLERIFEDHQKLCEAILMWPTISSNRLNFTRRLEKYSLLQSFSNDSIHDSTDLEGNIYLKEKSRKSWKKHFCVLRSSGLYFVPKGKSKVMFSGLNFNFLNLLSSRRIWFVWLNSRTSNYFLVSIGKRNLNHQRIFVLL